MMLVQRAAKAQVAKVGNTTYKRPPLFDTGSDMVHIDVANCTAVIGSDELTLVPNQPEGIVRLNGAEAIELAWDILRACGAVNL